MQAVERDGGDEIPWFVGGKWRIVIFWVGGWKIKGCFIGYQVRLWKVEFIQKVSFEENRVPDDSVAQFFGVRRDLSVWAEEKLKFCVRAAEESPSFKGTH